MARPCTICKKWTAEQRRIVDQALRDHQPKAVIARQFGTTWDMVDRHSKHLRDPYLVAERIATGAGFQELFAELEHLSELAKNTDGGADIKSLVALLTQKCRLLEMQSKVPMNGNGTPAPGGGEYVRIGSIAWFDSWLIAHERIEKGLHPFPWQQNEQPYKVLKKEEDFDA